MTRLFHDADPPPGSQGAQIIVSEALKRTRVRTDRGFGVFLLLQWLVASLWAFWSTPYWNGTLLDNHSSVTLALFWGGLLAVPTFVLTRRYPGEVPTRYTVAVAQMLMSSLLIHLTDGRIETHFHVFVSLAFLAFYAEEWLLLVAGGVILTDQLIRGIWFPATVWDPYTVENGSFLWAEHAAWIAFTVLCLSLDVRERRGDLLKSADNEARLAGTNAQLKQQATLLSNSETQLRQLAENTQTAFALTDATTGETLYVSPAFNHLLGDGRNGTAFWGDLSEVYRETAESLHRVSAKGSPGTGEVQLKNGDRWVRLATFPVHDATGGVYRVAVHAEDITSARLHESVQTEAYERERRIASTLQEVVLEAGGAAMPDGLTVETLYRPALAGEANVCGDFFDRVAVGGGIIALLIGDVSGKGLEAARHVMETKYALRAYLHGAQSPGAVLETLNRYLCDASLQPGAATMLAERFVALSLAFINPRTGHTIIACAGIEPSLVARQGTRAVQIEILGEAGGLPLGVDADAAYPEVAVTLEPGDLLVMVSDGVTEARNARRELLGLDGWARLVQKSASSPLPLHDRAETTLNAVVNHAGGRLTDDVCCVWVERE